MSRSIKIFTIAAIAAIVFSSCSGLGDKGGTLKVRSYNQGLSATLADIDESYEIDAILDVVYPDGSAKTVLTDHLGFYDFGTVPAGNYLIAPRYCPQDAAKTFVVVDGEATTGELPIPDLGLEFYLFNPAKSPVDTLGVRQALCEGIVRADILEAFSSSCQPLYSTIPASMAGTWPSPAHTMSESITSANEHLGTSGALSLEILFNTTTNQQAKAAVIKSEWEGLSGSGASSVMVSLRSLEFSAFLAARDTDKDFQIARGGWILESNNLLKFYETLAQYFDTEYEPLLATARARLADIDMAAYESALVAINDYLIDKALILPLYTY
jgi:hypothetical protein